MHPNIAAALASEGPPPPAPQVARILALDTHDLSTLAELPDHPDTKALVKKWTEALRRHDDAPPLRPVQAIILELAYRQLPHSGRGLLGQVGVGGGKTLAFALLPAVLGAKNPLLLIPPDMMEQTYADRAEWSKHYMIPPCRIMSYNKLSQADSTGALRAMAPDLILADECQALKRTEAARTKRFVRFMVDAPETRFCGMTGTLTSGKLADYAGLAELALRDGSPLPTSKRELEIWGAVIDPGGEPTHEDLDRLEPMVEWAIDHADPEGAKFLRTARGKGRYRLALQERQARTPGFLLTQASACAATIVIRSVYPELNKTARSALEHLSKTGDLPDGQEIIDASAMAAATTQLSLGFYYKWDWPNGEEDWDWIDARSEWAKSVREYLKMHARENFDSPFLVEQQVRAGNVRSERLVEALKEWDKERHKPPPPVIPIWLDFTPLAWAVSWALQRDRAIIWFKSRAVGDMLQKMGIPAFWGGKMTPDMTPRIALSETVYHKGKNFLTPWTEQLHLQPSPNPLTWEQLLGRTHRFPRDESDTIYCDVLQHTEGLQTNFERARAKAHAVQLLTRQKQKLVFADYF